MTTIRLKYVHAYNVRGRRFYYFRRKGQRARLPGPPGSPEFNEAYASAIAAHGPSRAGASRSPYGSVAALIGLYLETYYWKSALGAETRRQQLSILNAFRAEYGSHPIARLERKHLIGILSKRPPSSQRNWLKALKPVFDHGVEIGWLKANPARDIKIKVPKTDGFTPWTETEIDAFRRYHPIGTMPRLGLELLLGTIMRAGDVIALGPANIWNGKLVRRTAKTGAPLTLPILPELREALAAMPRSEAPTFLVNGQGQPFTKGDYHKKFAAWATAAGLPGQFRSHGLRKAGMTRLAQAGATPHEIQAWSGHKTLALVAHYTASVDQARLAESAVAKLRTKIG
jgi:integrase